MKHKIIWQYFTLSCLASFGGSSFINATYVTYLMNHGLGLFDINLVNFTYFLTIFICEIPTGAYADIFGRKKSFVMACALMSVSMFMYGMSDTFAMFVLAEVTAAIAYTFRSGAFQAWLVDSLIHVDFKVDITKVFARENLLSQIGGVIGAIAGAYLATVHPSYPWFIGGAIMFLTSVIALLVMKEEYFKKTAMSWRKGLSSMKEVVRMSVDYGMNNKAVRFILIITFIQVFAVQALNMFWQPFFKDLHVDPKNFGYIYAGIISSIALGALIISRFNTGENEKKIIVLTQSLVGVSALVASLMFKLPLALVFFLLHEAGRGTWRPLIDGYLQKRIPSEERATISSFCSVVPHMGGAIGLLVSGMVADTFGIRVAWIASGIILIIGGLFFMKKPRQIYRYVYRKFACLSRQVSVTKRLSF